MNYSPGFASLLLEKKQSAPSGSRIIQMFFCIRKQLFIIGKKNRTHQRNPLKRVVFSKEKRGI